MDIRTRLMTILVAFAVLTCGCLGAQDYSNYPKDDDGEPYWPPTMLDWAHWVASIVTWDDVKEIMKWAITDGRKEAMKIVEWYIKMLIIADANPED